MILKRLQQMICDLLKYVDDSTSYEVIKKGESSTEQIPMNEIQQWSSTNKFQLHPTKSMELCISFSCTKRHHTPVTIENNTVELVKSIKILGLTVQDDLKWNLHVHTSIKKAAKRL